MSSGDKGIVMANLDITLLRPTNILNTGTTLPIHKYTSSASIVVDMLGSLMSPGISIGPGLSPGLGLLSRSRSPVSVPVSVKV